MCDKYFKPTSILSVVFAPLRLCVRSSPRSLLWAAMLSMGWAGLVAAQEDSGNRLDEVAQEMKVAANQLSKKTTDKQTQKPQTDAVAKLDKLIEEFEKQKQNLGKGVNPNPSNPANASNIRSGPGGMGDLHNAKEQGNRWGDLPAHERDRILQSLTEGFPAHYQAILEAYYRRLAVEKRAEESEPDAKDAKSGSAPATSKSAAPASTKPANPEMKASK